MVSPRLDINERASDHTVSVLGTLTEVMEPDKQRTSAEFVNDSDTVIYLALGIDAVVNQGIRLNAAGGWFEISAINLWKGRITAIAAAGGGKVLCAVQVRQGRYE